MLFVSRHNLCKAQVYPTFLLISQPGTILTSGPARDETCLSQLEAGASSASIATSWLGDRLYTEIQSLMVTSAHGIQPKPPALHNPCFSHAGRRPAVE